VENAAGWGRHTAVFLAGATYVKITIHLPDDLHQGPEAGGEGARRSDPELIRTAVRHELLGAPPGQAERAQRRARLLAALGTLDSSVYLAEYLDELRAGWRR
jgi:hypothetical protein